MKKFLLIGVSKYLLGDTRFSTDFVETGVRVAANRWPDYGTMMGFHIGVGYLFNMGRSGKAVSDKAVMVPQG